MQSALSPGRCFQHRGQPAAANAPSFASKCRLHADSRSPHTSRLAVPAPILNAIARTQTLRSEWARQVFSLDADGVLTALSRQAKEVETQGVPNKVILAYLAMGPLLIENIAISEYIMATERLELEGSADES